MNLKEIQNLIKFVAKSGATEVKLEMNDVKITIKTVDEQTKADTTYIQQMPALAPQVASVPVAAPQVSSTPSEASLESSQGRLSTAITAIIPSIEKSSSISVIGL